MSEDRDREGETTESTERIAPGSMPPEEEGQPAPEDDEDKVDEESKESFPASDPPAW